MTRIYIVRHAEAEGNLYRRIHGQYDSLVTPLGYRQIEALSRRFQDIPVDAVYSSDLYRTRMTAKSHLCPQGTAAAPGAGFAGDRHGPLGGPDLGRRRTAGPERMNQFSRSDPDYDSPGGETFQAVQKRVVDTFRPPDPDPWGPDHRLCRHGVAIRTAMAAFYGYSLAQLDRILPSDNTGVSCVEVENGQPHVRVYADGSHLGEELSTLGKQTWWREQEAATPLEDQNVWYRAWDPVGERALYYRCRQEAWISVHGTDIPFPGEQFYEAARTASERNVASVMVAMVGDEVAGTAPDGSGAVSGGTGGVYPLLLYESRLPEAGAGHPADWSGGVHFPAPGPGQAAPPVQSGQRGGPAVLRPQRVSLYWPGNGQRSAPGAAGKVHRLRGMSGKRKTAPGSAFLPVSRADMEDRGWSWYDFLIVNGDAYVDHPSFGGVVIARVLEAEGYRVAYLAQPDWHGPEPFLAMGKPRLGVMISAGNLDSMVAHYTAAKKRRRQDAYSPGNRPGLRPDRATIVYANRVREAFGDVPLIIGGSGGVPAAVCPLRLLERPGASKHPL